jgi:sugar lactone lactonase YvrE
VLCCAEQGRGEHPPAVNKVNLSTMTSQVLLDSFEGRQFNSPNDVVLYCDGSIWFTGTLGRGCF